MKKQHQLSGPASIFRAKSQTIYPMCKEFKVLDLASTLGAWRLPYHSHGQRKKPQDVKYQDFDAQF